MRDSGLDERKPYTFTVQDACTISEVGTFRGKRVELIGGQFIVREPRLPSHASVVDRLANRLSPIVAETAIIRVQNPLQISDIDLPEPDLSLLRPCEDYYASDHPRPEDAYLVIEVANTSLRYDQTTKASLYASADIGTYWIVDVNARTVSVHTDPRSDGYEKIRVCGGHDTVALPPPLNAEITVNDLLTPQRAESA